MEHKNSILANTLEGMAADAYDKGKGEIQPVLTLSDVSMIVKALIAVSKATTGAVAEAKVTAFDHTIEMMRSPNYKERFKAEYYQTKVRYEKLKKFNTVIEAAERTRFLCGNKSVEEPKHDCPKDLLLEQQHIMGNYLHLLEVRAEIENVDL